jgi:prolyl 3-hydroxylase /prolyl 3,4-dihydroxylase
MKRTREAGLECINANILNDKNIANFGTDENVKCTDVQFIQFPFRCGIFSNFLNDSLITAKHLRKEVLAEKFDKKSNDLYEFYQSSDLKSSTQPGITKLRETIYSKAFVELMSTVTGLTLSSTIDLSAHRYPPDGYLLCHDDDVGSENDARKIAFILYLVEEDWSAADGGRLQLFDCDHEGDPSMIVHSIVPSTLS